MKVKWIITSLLIAGLLLSVADNFSFAQEPPPPEDIQPEGDSGIQAFIGSGITYQGQLKKDGNPINGTCDFLFSLWDTNDGGNQIGTTQSNNSVNVTEGLFTIPDLTFGAGTGYFNGTARWLKIEVRCPAGSGSYTILSPRQKLYPAPYALALPGLWTIEHTTSPNLIGGYKNNSTTNGVYGAVIGGGGANGVINRVTDRYGFVGGGSANQAGNNNTDTTDAGYASVVGGNNNEASGSAAFVGGGKSNISSGSGAFVGGGESNTASGGHATIGGGIYNEVSAPWDATVGGGYGNIANAQGSTVPGGIQARAHNFGQMAYSSGQFANPGDAQTSVFVVRGTTSDDDWHNLFLDGTGQRITVSVDHSMTFDILVVGLTQEGKTNGYKITGVVENDEGVLTQWHSASALHEDDSGWDVRVDIDAGAALHVQVNGDTGDTVRWVATVHIAEVAW